jgi:hypothetical protein
MFIMAVTGLGAGCALLLSSCACWAEEESCESGPSKEAEPAAISMLIFLARSL